MQMQHTRIVHMVSSQTTHKIHLRQAFEKSLPRALLLNYPNCKRTNTLSVSSVRHLATKCLTLHTVSVEPGNWWSQPGSNRRPPACKAGALPAELWPLVSQSNVTREKQKERRLFSSTFPLFSDIGGSGRIRTTDLTLIRGAL